MATIGLAFGSATSGTGFDVASTVTSILGIESAVETPWKAQLASLQAQDTAFTSLGTSLSTLATALSSLTVFDGVLSSKEGSSSNTNALTLSSASSNAVAGSHSIVVNKLAQTSSAYSGRITDATDLLTGSIDIQVGAGTSKTVTLPSGGETLAALASAINTGSYGVTASVVTDTLGSRISLVSNTSGSAGEMTLTPNLTDATTSKAVSLQTGQTGVDAELVVDGLETTSASNTVTGAIPGVTFQLLAASPNTSIQVQITNDNSTIETAMQALVTAYNAVVDGVKTQEGKDASGNAEPLFGDRTLALIQTQLASALTGGTASGTIKSIGQLGLALGQDGKLTLTAATLDTVLNSNFSDVAGFLQASGSWGQSLSTTLNQLGSSSTAGAVYLALHQNSSTEASLTADIANEDARMVVEKTRLTAELTTANQILQSIPSQIEEQDKIYSAMTGYNTKG